MLPDPLDPTAQLPFERTFRMQRAAPNAPGVSIVIPVMNAGPFLERTIRSLLMNDLTGCELILMDGASTDGTMQIVEHYRAHFTVVVSEPDKGQSEAINKGFARAKKPILGWLNGDDLILPNRLKVVRETFRDRPGAKMLVGNAYLTALDLSPLHRLTYAPERLTFGKLLNYTMNHLVQPAVFFAREAWRACGPLKEDLHYAMDADLFLTMAGRYTVEHVPVDLAYSVYHEGAKTLRKRAESLSELALVQARHGGVDEARITLNALVKLHNETKAKADAAETLDTGADATLMRRRLAALTRERQKSRALLARAADLA